MGNCLFMRDSLIEMVSQRANSVYRAVSLCYVTQTCVRINFMSSSLSIAEATSAALKKKKKKKRLAATSR